MEQVLTILHGDYKFFCASLVTVEKIPDSGDDLTPATFDSTEEKETSLEASFWRRCDGW